MNIEERNRLVVENLPLVGYLVSDLCARAAHLSREDLASAGSLGLVLAADAYDPTIGVPFGAFARRRITGALTDELRSLDWAGRGTRKRIKAVQAVNETLTNALGRKPSTDEIASALGLTREAVEEIIADEARMVSPLQESAVDSLVAETIAPEEATLAGEQTSYLRAAVESLPEHLRRVITAIYLEGLRVKDVADELGVTSSAVSQQRSEAIRLMRDGLAEHYADAPAAVPRSPSARRNAYLETFTEAVRGIRRVGAAPLAAPAASSPAVPHQAPGLEPVAG
ncbi:MULTISPECIES: sigma-70 family RNA polymerase sigma factor [Arthrobacter]|uniref:Sigma-70 family RNA polymerase sigma factor n=2 Tax=Arthrobacter TaxID=1663 RepID=A0ABU9KIG2_9MICC|nr:sigma-70 family RNA polymerase sigma factor [Arthrobacter sp. YJM1]MDP5226322.1 sigma-70 family RNA polymerase sigma factor [Arthrobacter sp. YJM1]